MRTKDYGMTLRRDLDEDSSRPRPPRQVGAPPLERPVYRWLGLCEADSTPMRVDARVLATAYTFYCELWEKDVWNSFQLQLRDLANDIDRRNEGRRYPFNLFNPLRMNCSISV